MYNKKNWASVLALLMVISLLLAACGATPEPQVVEVVVTQVVKETIKETVVVEGEPEVVEVEVTTVVEVEKVVTVAPEPVSGPSEGGTLVVALDMEPQTLDPHFSTFGGREFLYLGATLVAKDPFQDGAYVPYLAESWQASEDGLTWDFKLREDVTFHNGNPLTAHDFAWTFARMLDPEIQSPAAGSSMAAVASAEAVDDYTLRLTLHQPYFPLLENLELGFAQPLSQEAVEEWGEEYGRHPVGVGPYKFVEWVTGDRVVLERNPDYNWAPAFNHQGAPYIETVVMRYIPEYATRLAGMEAGEIDLLAGMLDKDVPLLESTGSIDIYEGYSGGMTPYVALNIAQPPFDDVLVRQAFNYAVDKETLIEVVAGGAAIPQYGPIAHVTHGYWPGVEYVGYRYDLDKAKALMAEAGYTTNAEGMLEKDGQPFELVLKAIQGGPFNRVPEVLQEQFKQLGVAVEIEAKEQGVLYGELFSGAFSAAVSGYDYTEFAVVPVFFHSDNIGALNFGSVNDPELDALLDATNYETDPERRQAAADGAQRRMVEQAFVIPLFTPSQFAAINTRVQGVVPETFGTTLNRFYLNDLYLEE